LNQSGSTQLRPAFGNPAAVFGFVGVGNSRNDPEVRSQVSFFGEIMNVTDDRQQDAAAESADPLDAGQVRVAF